MKQIDHHVFFNCICHYDVQIWNSCKKIFSNKLTSKMIYQSCFLRHSSMHIFTRHAHTLVLILLLQNILLLFLHDNHFIPMITLPTFDFLIRTYWVTLHMPCARSCWDIYYALCEPFILTTWKVLKGSMCENFSTRCWKSWRENIRDAIL